MIIMLHLVGMFCSCSNEDIPEGWSKGDNTVFSGYVAGFDDKEAIIEILDMAGSSIIEDLSPGTGILVGIEEITDTCMLKGESFKFRIKAFKQYPHTNPHNSLGYYIVCYCKIITI